MRSSGADGGELARPSLADAEILFHSALVRSHRNREFIGEVESAAAQFCRERRRQGDTPEQVLKDAKRVIDHLRQTDEYLSDVLRHLGIER